MPIKQDKRYSSNSRGISIWQEIPNVKGYLKIIDLGELKCDSQLSDN